MDPTAAFQQLAILIGEYDRTDLVEDGEDGDDVADLIGFTATTISRWLGSGGFAPGGWYTLSKGAREVTIPALAETDDAITCAERSGRLVGAYRRDLHYLIQGGFTTRDRKFLSTIANRKG